MLGSRGARGRQGSLVPSGDGERSVRLESGETQEDVIRGFRQSLCPGEVLLAVGWWVGLIAQDGSGEPARRQGLCQGRP